MAAPIDEPVGTEVDVHEILAIQADRIAELEQSVKFWRRRAQAPSFVLLRFKGQRVDGDEEFELFDAYAIDAGTGNSFPLTPGYDHIEVYAERIGRG